MRAYGVERVMMSGTGLLLNLDIQPHSSRLCEDQTEGRPHRTPASALIPPLDI